MSARQIPPTALFQPEVFREICAADFARLRRNEQPRALPADSRRRFMESSICLEATRAANLIDPAIDIGLIPTIEAFSNLDGYFDLGSAYYQVCGLVRGRRFTDVVLLPFLTQGGGDKYILNILNALAEADPEREFLVLTGQGGVRHGWLDRLPENALFIDLFNRFDALDADALETLTLRIIEAVAPDANIHIKSSAYSARFFGKFGRLLKDARRIYYRFSDMMIHVSGMPFTRGYAFGFLSDHLGDLDLIVTDNQSIVREDRGRFGVAPDKWACIYTRTDPIVDESRVRGRATSNRLLWASRLDSEKRPDLLLKIAAALHQQRPEVTVEVHGRTVLDAFDVSLFDDLPNVVYRGEYWSFAALEPDRFDAFLYTTAYDGLPNVVLEALASGLPVIAPDVGGLSEAVITGRTGVLIDNAADEDELVGLYLEAIESLYASPDDRISMGLNGLELIATRHSRDAFLDKVRGVFGPDRP